VAEVEVSPQAFANVSFEHARIQELASTLADQLGITVPVRISVDERTPLSKVRQTSLDPVALEIESGALEDNKRPRQFGEREAADVLGRALAKAADRLDPAFGAPALDEQLPLPHLTAWDTYCVGRLVRLGYEPQRQRRLYAFELRHGFTDEAVVAFERIWSAESLTWAELVAISDVTRAVVDAA
jgi:hypothetical protein